MADLSAETQAIIERLKDEGTLIRNRGTNSIRSVKIQLDKFQPIFESISAACKEQTSILRQQAGLAEEALEAQRTKEQLDELEKEKIKKETSSSPLVTEEENKTINSIGDAIANAFSLKNLALAGAGIFVGYNLLKGFVNERFNGAWDEMEGGIAALGPRLTELSNFDFASMRTQFDQLMADISSMRTSLESITGMLTNLQELFQRIADLDWLTVASALLAAFPAVGFALRVMRNQIRIMNNDLIEGRRTRNGQTWWQRALGIGRAAPEGGAPTSRFNPDGTVRGEGQTARPGSRPAPTPRVAPVGGGRGSYGIDTPEGRVQVRAGAAAARPGQFRLDSQGRLQRPGGGFVSDAEALSALEESLRQNAPKYARIFSGLTRALAIAGVVFTAIDAYRIYSILSDDQQYPSDQDKINAIGPIIGPMITTLGAGAIGAIAGGFAGGPWGALLGGAAAAIAAGFLTPESFGRWVASAIFEFAPSDEDRAASRQAAETAWEQTNEFAGMGDASGGSGSPASSSTDVAVTPLPAGSSRRRMTRRGSRRSNAEVAPTEAENLELGSGGRGTVVEGAGERAAYMREQEMLRLDALIEAQRQSVERESEMTELERYLQSIEESAQQSNGGAVVINAPTTIAPNVTHVEGAKSVNQLSVRSGGGGMGAGSANPYGLPGLAN